MSTEMRRTRMIADWPRCWKKNCFFPPRMEWPCLFCGVDVINIIRFQRQLIDKCQLFVWSNLIHWSIESTFISKNMIQTKLKIITWVRFGIDLTVSSSLVVSLEKIIERQRQVFFFLVSSSCRKTLKIFVICLLILWDRRTPILHQNQLNWKETM